MVSWRTNPCRGTKGCDTGNDILVKKRAQGARARGRIWKEHVIIAGNRIVVSATRAKNSAIVTLARYPALGSADIGAVSRTIAPSASHRRTHRPGQYPTPSMMWFGAG